MASVSLRQRRRVSSSSSSSSTSDPPTPPTPSVKQGVDEDGRPFSVPETVSVLHTLVFPWLWSLPSLVVLASLLVNAAVPLLLPTSPAYHIAVFVLFRASYNIGLGVLLHYQSKYRVLTEAGRRLLASPNTRSARLLKLLARARMTHLQTPYNPDDYPACFNTWLAFRFLVDIVLCNDGLSYVIVVAKCWTVPETFSAAVILQYVVGVGLAAFNYWAKVDAHRAIGAYSWYWADCFFPLRQHLTFDGVFELFPHPMYTVGYSVYYGAALMARSYVVLFVSLAAHLMQLGFLTFFENPHIERTYGHAEPDKDSDRILYDPSQGLFPRRTDPIYFFRLDLFRSTDHSLLLLSAYACLATALVADRRLALGHLLLWLALHWVGVSLILRGQSKSGWWIRHFTSRGRTLHEAFTSWKVFYNTTRSVALVSFVACSIRFAHIPSMEEFLTARYLSYTTLGVVLVVINVYSSVSSFSSLGDFAFFYGDFFIDYYRPETRYNGIYRYLNNPDCVTGYAGLHGMALIAQSWTMFFVALAAQAANIIFVEVVEVPHMHKIYSEAAVRKQTPLNRALMSVLPSDLVMDAERIQRKAIDEIYSMYSKLALSGVSARPANRRAVISAPKSVFLHSSLSLTYKAPEYRSGNDWIGVFSVNVPTLPGMVGGRFMNVPGDKEGEIVFPPEKLPMSPGVYELRYLSAGWDIAAVTRFCVLQPASSDASSRRSSEHVSQHDAPLS